MPTESVWSIVINEMHELEERFNPELSGNYRMLLERSITGEINGQFEAKRFRMAMESLQEAEATMRSAVPFTDK